MRRNEVFYILLILVMGIFGDTKAAEKTVTELARDASPAVMLLQIKDANGKEIALGTGFVISPDGLLVTAKHVIKSAAAAEAQAGNRGVFQVVGVCGVDDANDLALLKLEASNLKFLELASTETVQAGEKVVVIGSPHGLDGTVTDGIVSAIRDEVGIGKRLQITAAISPGSSGSPVLNSDGKVIGVASFYLKESQALNFAIPAELAACLEKTYRKLSTEESNDAMWGDKPVYPGVKPLPGTIVTPIQHPNHFDELTASAEWEPYFQASIAKDKQKTLKAAQALAKTHPKNPLAYLFLGGSLQNVGFLQEATNTIEAGLKLDNKSASLWTALGNIQKARWLNQEKEFRERMVTSFHNAILCDPESAVAWYELADALRYMGNKNYEALDAINNALKIDSQNKPFLWMKGRLLLSVDANKEAYNIFKVLVDTNPSDASNWEGFGLAARKSEQDIEAEKAARKAVDMDPNSIDGWAVLIDIYETCGRKRELAALWKEIRERRPTFEWAIKVNLASLQKSRSKEKSPRQ